MSLKLAAACLLGSAVAPTAGDLSTAVRRQQGEPAVLPAAAPLSSPLVVPLVRSSARGPGGKGKNLYVGKVSMGQPPQVMSVTFDTASGMLILPHRACHNSSCLAHQRYSPWESSTAMDTNANGGFIDGVQDRLAKGSHVRDVATITFTQADLGEGDLKGVFVRDGVCVAGQGAQACVDMAVLAATSMDSKPFLSMPNDGIVGLGLQSLAVGPMSSFLNRLFEGSVQVLSQFGMALDGAHGELHFGGHDSANLASPLRWFPVDHPEQGYWQVAIQSVQVGNSTVDPCHKGCHGIIDTGVSHLGVQSGRLPPLQRALQTGLKGAVGGCSGEDLSLDLGGMMLVLKATEYATEECTLQLGSMDLPESEFTGVYALGGALLHRYYTAFDWKQQRVGFAPLARGAKGKSVPEELEGAVLV